MKKLVSALLALAACSEQHPGNLLAKGLGRGLQTAPGGGAVAFLLDARHPDDRAVPDDLMLGDLYLASASGKAQARKVGGGVSSGSGSYRFSPNGAALALLAAYRFKAGAGELFVASVQGGEPRKLDGEVSAFAWAPQGEKLAWVANGKLFAVAGSTAPPKQLAEGVQSFIWSPDGSHIAARAPLAAGGELALVDVAAAQRKPIARGVTDFAFAADGALGMLGLPTGKKGGDRPLLVLDPGAGQPREVGRATSFVFSPDGRDLLALSTDKQPGEAVGDLLRVVRSGAAKPLAQRGAEYRFTPAGDALFLARYDVRSRAGTLTFAPADGSAPKEIAPKVQSFSVAPGGKAVLYLAHKPSKGDFKIELWAAPLGGSAAPRKIDEGVYGYEATADGKTLYWKARCGYGPRSCSLFRGPLDGSSPPVELVKNVAGFDLSADGSRLLVAAPHRGSSRAVDLSWLPANAAPTDKPRPLAADVDPSAKLIDASGSRAAFAVLAPGKAAVYVADLR